MSKALGEYSKATARLREIQEGGPEEELEAHLAEMDAIWARMTAHERDVWRRIYG